MGAIAYMNDIYPAGATAARDSVFDNTGTSLIATNTEDAIKEVNENVLTKAERDDISTLQCTGSANTTGSTILAGRYFYLNGVLCKAKVDIANNATFTLNTNFTVVTIDEELSALNSKITFGFKSTRIADVSDVKTETNITVEDLSHYSVVYLICTSSGASSFNTPVFCPIDIFKLGKSITAVNQTGGYYATFTYINDTTVKVISTGFGIRIYGLRL